MYRLKIVTSLIFLFECFILNSQTHYFSYLNDFKPFHFNNATISNNLLLCENTKSTEVISLIDSISTNVHTPYNFTVRFKSVKNNSQNLFGIVFNYIDENNYFTATIHRQTKFANENDFLFLTISRRLVNKDSTICTVAINAEYNDKLLYSLKLDSYNNQTNFYFGTKSLKHICSISNIKNSVANTHLQLGLQFCPNSKTAIERIIFRQERNLNIAKPIFTKEDIDRKINNSSDENEGYWIYLDRNLDESKLKIGGKYVVAIIRNESGYDIFYVSGAVVNNQNWHLGMRKGTLKETPLLGNYDLIWYDSYSAPLQNDTFATFSGDNTLTLQFPTLKSSFRLIKTSK